ncbi:MAG: hypothetical protein V1678_02310 [Candidatus Aenigmatarchaeota archaeon]
MEKENYFIILFSAILVSSLFYFYSNMSSFECYVINSTKDVMSDIKYDFEPEGSLYGQTRIYRFIISSTAKNIEYYGMNITDAEGNVLFSQLGSEPDGGSIVYSMRINETKEITTKRFFKKKCFPEIVL